MVQEDLAAAPEDQLHIGVLALQGAFEEHAALLQELGVKVSQVAAST